jgi:uncharacterized protein (DUF362 family)
MRFAVDERDVVSEVDKVAVAAHVDGYSSTPPYSPGVGYPEYPFGDTTLLASSNPGYEGVRQAFRLLGLDAAHYGTKQWNPLGGLVQPGRTVVLKPNFVRDFRETQPGHADCLITHGSIIRAVIDYVYIALGRRGRLVIADAPQNDADFGAIRRMAGLDELQAFYHRYASLEVEVHDLRQESAEKINGVVLGHRPLPGDPAGYVRVNLGRHSAFAEIEHLCHLLYGAEYDTGELRSHHHDDVHEYLISKTVLDADCVINLPKLKTHKKTGLTACMKNLVGINGNKNWLPHHREGTPAQGGDQFADARLIHRMENAVVAGFRRVFPHLGPLRRVIAGPAKAGGRQVFGDTNTDTIRSGNWYGNDTTWRMVIDLNRILLYAAADGQVRDQPIRRVFNVVDGIVAGEGNGPLDPTPRPAGAVLAGTSTVAVDVASARLMGFDYERLPMLRRAFDDHPLPLASFGPEEIQLASDEGRFDGPLGKVQSLGGVFSAHFGWQGHVEAPEYLHEKSAIA